MNTLPPELEAYRSVSEKVAAEIIGVRPMTLANWRSQRRGPAYRKIQRSIFYSLAEIIAWRDRHKIDPEAAG